MFRRNKNFIIAYILLVGFPILVLGGVLKRGSRMAPPLSVDGTWTVEASGPLSASLLCQAPLASAKSIALVISQSGRNVVLKLEGKQEALASGVIEGTTLRAFRPAGPAGCTHAPLVLNAFVNANAVPRSLTGTVSSSDCSSCAGIAFRAVRRIASPTPRN